MLDIYNLCRTIKRALYASYLIIINAIEITGQICQFSEIGFLLLKHHDICFHLLYSKIQRNFLKLFIHHRLYVGYQKGQLFASF